MGDAKFFGIMIFDDGQLGSVTYIAHYDYVKGNGPYSTYETVRFDDGSIIRFHNTGTAALNSGKTTFTNDKIDVLGGEGKYKGVTGTAYSAEFGLFRSPMEEIASSRDRSI